MGIGMDWGCDRIGWRGIHFDLRQSRIALESFPGLRW